MYCTAAGRPPDPSLPNRGWSVNPNPTELWDIATRAPNCDAREGREVRNNRDNAPKPWLRWRASNRVCCLGALVDDAPPLLSWPRPRSTGPSSSPHEEVDMEGGSTRDNKPPEVRGSGGTRRATTMIGWYPPRPPTYHHPNGRPPTIYSPEALESINPPPHPPFPP